jgi:hypothetical protein
MKLTEHEKRYRNTACLCHRPLLTQKAEERGANLYRCVNCGGWRRILPADHESANAKLDDRERIWYEVAILVFIVIATIAVYIADNAVSQYAQLLQEVKQR